MTEPFDGDAISRADREFLDSLGDHPLARHPLYGVPCPPQPDFGPFDPKDTAQMAARMTFYGDVVVPWLLVNWAYREGAFFGKTPSAISLVDGEIVSLAELRGRMDPWALRQHRSARRDQIALAGRGLAAREGPALDPPRGDAPRQAAADLRGGRLCGLQPLPAAGASGRRRRSRGVRDLLRPPHP